ncbi:MAG: DUF1854 domain-containing protein [Planctomycetota bacterium]|jgi:hypothetical protein
MTDATPDDRPLSWPADPGERVSRIERNAVGQLVVHLAGGKPPVTDVKLTRYFPWSMPEAFISVRTSQGGEVALLADLDQLDPASRAIVEAELRDKVFNPKLLRILDYNHEFGISSMTAQTDRGRVIFQFRGREDIRLLSPTRALIRDVDGNTYELPDLDSLDPASRSHLSRYF